MNDQSNAVVRLRFPAKPQYLVLGRLVLSGLARSVPMDDETLGDLKLALTEGCSNAVRHAYPGEPGKVDVTYRLGDDRLEVTIEDEGPGFEPEATSPPLDPTALSEGGLGLAIIRAVTDACDVRGRDGGRGACLHFVKMLREEVTS